MKRLRGLVVIFFLLSGCTTIGIQDMDAVKNNDFSTVETFRICIYKDVEVSDKRAQEIIAAITEEFAPFGVKIEIPWIQPWERPGFTWKEILNDVAFRPLEPPCDRMFVLVGRDFKDFLWGSVMPEMHGAVETNTMTKGFAVAELGSINQLLTLKSPSDIIAHEVYHLLGCGLGCLANSCYNQIVRIKIAARKNREVGRNFFPAMTQDGRIFWTRNDINKEFGLEQEEPSKVAQIHQGKNNAASQ